MPGLVWGSKIVIEDRPCCETTRSTPSATDGAEAAVLAALPDRASRDGRVLTLKLDGGRSLKITDCDGQACNAEEWRVHRLVAWWPQLRYYVVDVGLYEGQMAFLIREADGLVVRVVAPPVLSPNARYAIAWHTGVIDGGPFMELLEIKPDRPTINEIYPGPCPGHDETLYPGINPVWQNDTEVVFRDSTFFGKDTPKFRLTMRIVAGLNLLWKCYF